jgi:hypothetical protein
MVGPIVDSQIASCRVDGEAAFIFDWEFVGIEDEVAERVEPAESDELSWSLWRDV